MPNVTFKWPADKTVKDVIVTGTFDNWSQSLPLVKRPDGSFELEVPLPSNTNKIEFKFVINGENWITSDDYWTVVDSTGNTNNLIEFNENGAILKNNNSLGKTDIGKTEIGKTIIPESGLSMGNSSNIKNNEKEFNPTVMPSQEGVQTTLGEPGIVVPENSQDISAFKEVRNVDAKQLNADIKKENEDKEKEIAKTQSSESSKKYVKKVKKLVPAEESKTEAKSEAKPEAKQDTKTEAKKVPAKTSTSKNTTTAKKEKKGLFGKLKKAFS